MLKENFKSYILISLIISSLVQVGILWDYQDHRLPFNFFAAFSGRSGTGVSNNVEGLKQDAFKPYRIIVSAGEGESHWILNRDSDVDSEQYDKLWNEGRSYLLNLLTSSNIQSTSEMPAAAWDKLAVKKGVILEFKTTLKPNLLAFFLDKSVNSSSNLTGVYKMLISPWDNINYTNTIYILEGNSKVQVYEVSMGNSKFSKEKYSELMETLETMTQNDDLKSYKIIKETNNAFPYPVRQDIPIAIGGARYESFQSVNCFIPESFEIKANPKASEIEEKFDSIFGKEKDTYDMLTDSDSSVIFKNINNIYRFYEDGVLEYRNLTYSPDNERLDEGLAMKQALEFVEKLKLLPANADFYLSGIQESASKDRFRITFDYKTAGLPVVFNYKMKDANMSTLNNAITIEVNNKKVISCWWILRNFEPLKEKKEYSVKFDDLMDKTLNEYPKLKNDKNFSLKDASVGYEVNAAARNAKLVPLWFIFTESGAQYPVEMIPKKGE